uniref:Signal recognition particle 19 kDa protein n=1 Tax=Anas zonorhyncha TaxID=75864 RepID=A0A8B9UBB5_9AVES
MAGGRAAARPRYRPSRCDRSPPGPGGPRRGEAGARGEGGAVRAVTARPLPAACGGPGRGLGGLVPPGSLLGRSLRASAAVRCAPGEFICIYPAYLNNKKTIAEGRRIPIDKVIWGAAGKYDKNKMYPREWNRDVQYRGRVRIQLKQDDGNPCLPQFPTRKSVMLYAAETIPKLKTRTQKMGGSDQSLQQGEGGKKGKGKKKK